MFEFIFDLITDPLGLPIEWYKEWIILVVIGLIARYVAYDKVGDLYDSGVISGSAAGSFVHWVFRAALFMAIWAITYGIIWIGKFIMAHKIQSIICACIILTVVLVIMLLFWMKKRKNQQRSL